MRILGASYRGITSSGFVKALLYSIGSSIIATLILFFNSQETIDMFVKDFPTLGLYIPAINMLLVFIKQVWDEYRVN